MPDTRSQKRLIRSAFLFVMLAELAFGVWLGLRGFLLGDSVSRTANAYYVLNVLPYRYASMGLVWNPLPSTLQLPFIALAKLWKPIVTYGFGAAAVSAMFAAWGAAILLRTFLRLRVSRGWSLLFTGLYGLNPYIFYYGANGMSEMISFTFSLLIICSFVLWMEFGRSEELVRIGLGFVGLFYTRYESIPFAIAVGVVIALYLLISKRERRYIKGGKAEIWFYVEGTLLLVFLPMAYAAIVWVIYNWMISGNPFYFANSGYSNLAHSEYYVDLNGIGQVLSFLWKRTWPFLIPLAGLLTERLFSRRLLRFDVLIILICTLVLTVFQFMMLLNGSSQGWVRYMCYPFIIATGFFPYEIKGINGSRVRRGAAVILALFMAFVMIFMGWAMIHDETYREDTLLMLPEGSAQVADYVNARLSDKCILMDAFRTYYIFMLLDHPENVIMSSSLNFMDVIKDPAVYNVDYIIVPTPSGFNNMDALNIAYEGLYNNDEPWAELEAEIGIFRLFKVTDRVWSEGGAEDEQ